MVKKYDRCRTYDEIVELCAANNLTLYSAGYDRGDDSVLIVSPGVKVRYNTVSGRFRCRIDPGVAFNNTFFVEEVREDSFQFDGELWYQQLLDFFYTNDPLIEGKS